LRVVDVPEQCSPNTGIGGNAGVDEKCATSSVVIVEINEKWRENYTKKRNASTSDGQGQRAPPVEPLGHRNGRTNETKVTSKATYRESET